MWRRTAPALTVAFIGFVAARAFVDTWLRQRFETPLTATWAEVVRSSGSHRQLAGRPTGLSHAWILSQFPSDKFGHAVHVVLGPCAAATGTHAGAIKCLAQRSGVVYSHAVYQPASRFWLFQGIETALFGGAAIVLIGFAAWWTHQRTR